MPDCELLTTCPFFKEDTYGMTEELKEDYCRGNYTWCGRYMAFKSLEKEAKAVFTAIAPASKSKGWGYDITCRHLWWR